MGITWRLLLYFIRDLHPIVVRQPRDDQHFLGIKQLLIRELMDEEEDFCISISDRDMFLSQAKFLTKEDTVLVCSDIPLPKEEAGSCRCGVIQVQKAYGVPYLMNRLIRVFQTLTAWDKNMHIAALEGKSVQELLDMSEEILAYPLIVFDAGFDVLAYTSHKTSRNIGYQETVKNGFTDATIMSTVKANQILGELKCGEPYVAPAAADEHLSNIYLGFYDGQTTLGFVCVYLDEHAVDDGYLDLLSMFGETVKFCLKRDYEGRRFGRMMYETVLQNLMNPVGLSEEQIAGQIRNLEGISSQGRFYLGVLEFQDGQNVSLPFLARRLNVQMHDVKPFLYEDKICLLRVLQTDSDAGQKGKTISGRNQEAGNGGRDRADSLDASLLPLSERETQNIIQLLSAYSYTLGISNEFSVLTDLRFAFRQAKAAIDFGSMEGKQICRYEEYYMFDLIRTMQAQMPAEYLKTGFYRALTDYDKQHGTRYLKIILTYVEYDCNATHAAEALFAHRNTVRKAVEFVQERWQVCLSDTEVKYGLMMGKLIDQFFGYND